MNKTAALTLLLACMATALPGTLTAQMANPLRGQAAIDQTNRVHDFKPMMKEQPPLERAYVQQPPVIPHQIDGYIQQYGDWGMGLQWHCTCPDGQQNADQRYCEHVRRAMFISAMQIAAGGLSER